MLVDQATHLGRGPHQGQILGLVLNPRIVLDLAEPGRVVQVWQGHRVGQYSVQHPQKPAQGRLELGAHVLRRQRPHPRLGALAPGVGIEER